LDYIDQEYEKLGGDQEEIYNKMEIAEREHPDWINVRWLLADLTKGLFNPYDQQSINMCGMRRFTLHKKY